MSHAAGRSDLAGLSSATVVGATAWLAVLLGRACGHLACAAAWAWLACGCRYPGAALVRNVRDHRDPIHAVADPVPRLRPGGRQRSDAPSASSNAATDPDTSTDADTSTNANTSTNADTSTDPDTSVHAGRGTVPRRYS